VKSKLLIFLFSTALSADLLSIYSISSDFIQEIVNVDNNKIVYRGKMYAKKHHNRTVWIYKEPITKYIYYKDGEIVIIEPDLEQATFAKLDNVPNILSLLKSSKRISKDKLVTKFNGNSYTIRVRGSKILRLEYLDEMQNRVDISFKNQIINKKIDNSKFIYSIPSEYDILEQ
jgi:outer membrane lipoprotein carrier protein